MKMKAEHPCIIIHFSTANILPVCWGLFQSQHQLPAEGVKHHHANGWIFTDQESICCAPLPLRRLSGIKRNSSALRLCQILYRTRNI